MVCSIAAASGSIELSVIEIFEKISWIHSKNDNLVCRLYGMNRAIVVYVV